MIQEQVRLPVRVAFEVVMQGIRIRFGRSVVTIMGVMLGIAFLMSILTGQALKRGVAQEETARQEVRRMASFLSAEMGPPSERTIGLLVSGPLSEREHRLLLHLQANGLAHIQWSGFNGATLGLAFDRVKVRNVAPPDVATGASAVLVMGAGALPAGIDWQAMLASARQRIVAVSGDAALAPSVESAVVVALERTMRPDELERAKAAQRRERYRSTWIIVVSLLVTVIGISNAMLMSVTERFREIGTMKCLGALSAFVRLMFLIESGFMGIVGGAAGCVAGVVFSVAAYGFTYGFMLTSKSLGTEFLGLLGGAGLALLAGVILSVIAALYPAGVASRMVPADALRSNV